MPRTGIIRVAELCRALTYFHVNAWQLPLMRCRGLPRPSLVVYNLLTFTSPRPLYRLPAGQWPSLLDGSALS
jgi:hypothetical protein